MARSTTHYADNKTNNSLKKLHNKLRPAGTPVQRVEYIIELLLLRIFEVKLRRDDEFAILRPLFKGDEEQKRLFSYLQIIDSKSITEELNKCHFPFYGKIIANVKKTIKGTDLSPKVMDQLVLIQSVFANSNFTNNVQSGNLEEVITEVANIDETLLLTTDLLGDAIESALSEQGGTKDIGLYRTPDHIRQFMVALAEPTIADTIMDPACGTGGFLFDSYEYCIERCFKEGNYPNSTSHPEIIKWYEDYFKTIDDDYPDANQAENFYRHGIYGVEYLGMIKKMAAVNLYVRGLNPSNIEQGDSLNKFGSSIMPNSKSVVLANPPFGAETDQTSYPNVWEEYSTEKETTILFVKLMLDSLQDGGRCAVIVSEGFLTWDQASAKELRKKILTEANLKAVIGLPQGVFVSKNGVGPKTSILFFEKGTPTEKTWFYQVQNDGFTIGTNRKIKKGCQLVDALNIYHKFIKLGLTPPEQKNSFVIEAEWIKTLDPRVEQRIKGEVEEAAGIKKTSADEKLAAALCRKIKEKKISKQEMEFELKQNDDIWKAKIDAEIEQKVLKAYSYSYNSTTYHSSFNTTQFEEWNKLIGNKDPDPINTLKKRYKALMTQGLQKAFEILSKFNLKNAVEADIVREYVSNTISTAALENYPKLKSIDTIFKMGAKYPIIKIGQYLIENTEKVKPSKKPDIHWRTLGVSNETGVFLNNELLPEETDQSYYLVKKNEFCYNPYRINVGSIGLNKYNYDNQIISGAYIVFGTDENELLPEYLELLIKHRKFNDYVNKKANTGNGVRMNFTFADICEWEIPLPTIDEQYFLISKYQKKVEIIRSSQNIIDNIDIGIDDISASEYRLGECVIINQESINPTINYENDEIIYVDISCVENGAGIISYGNTLLGKNAPSRARRMAKIGDVIVSTVRPNLRGFAYLKNIPGKVIFSTGFCTLTVKDTNFLMPEYLYILFMNSKKLMEQMQLVMEKASYPSINKDNLESFNITIPCIDTQKSVVDQYDLCTDLKNKLKALINNCNKDVQKLINDIWNEEE